MPSSNVKTPSRPCSSRPISFFFIPSIVALLKLSPLMGLYAKTEFHVLAVDDSPIDRMLIERLLQTYSYQVTTVDSGLKALEFLRGENNHRDIKVNMVITDYCMPGMTGYDLLRRIKESKTMKDIPVVIMSSENNTSRISRCLEEGAEEFLLKPVKRPDVEKLISHLQTGKDRQK